MIKNYFKIAIRNLLRNRSFAIINIAGFALSIACVLIIIPDVQFEKSFDNFYPDKDRIARVVSDGVYKDGSVFHNSGVPLALEDALRTELPQLKKVTSIISQDNSFISVGDSSAKGNRKFKETEGIYYTERSFFEIFSSPWLAGNPEAALSEPYSVALSKTIAEKYFGDWKKAIGQTIKINNSTTLMVKGVMNDPLPNTNIPVWIAISFQTFAASDSAAYKDLTDWGNLSSNVNCFVALPPGISFQQMNEQVAALSKRHYTDETSATISNHLQPVSDMHFNTDYDTAGGAVVKKSTLNGMQMVALFILLMACINFINLSTAMSARRSKEVGVRKVLGSSRTALMKQFMIETFLIVSVAAVIGILLAALALPIVRDLTNLPDKVSLLTNYQIWIALMLLIVSVTIFAGGYPSLILSRFRPALALKSRIGNKPTAGLSLRTSLVIFQFAISQVFIIATIITIRQLGYINETDLGIDKTAVMQVPLYSDTSAIKRFPAFKNEIEKLPSVLSVSFSSDAPASQNDWSTNFAFNHSSTDADYHLFLKFADADYFKTYGIHFLAGHGFIESDTTKEVVVNETLLDRLGITNPEDAIGKDIRLGSGAWKPITGVIKDFKTNSLKESVKPLYISTRKTYYGVAGIKIQPGHVGETVAAVSKIWNTIYPEYYFENTFLDQDIADFYLQDEKLSKLYKIVAAIAIFISCLGLFGLVSFITTNRTKEVGIRKVLGASVIDISSLFLKYFVILIVVALLIAIPVGWYLMNGWLQNFVFRIHLDGWIFIIAATISLAMAILTVMTQILKAALANPVNSLRTE